MYQVYAKLRRGTPLTKITEGRGWQFEEDRMELARISGHRDLRVLQNGYCAPFVSNLAARFGQEIRFSCYFSARAIALLNFRRGCLRALLPEIGSWIARGKPGRAVMRSRTAASDRLSRAAISLMDHESTITGIRADELLIASGSIST